MGDKEQGIFQAALSLPPPSRAELADALWASLPDEQLGLPLDEAVQRAWANESRRRMLDVDAGRVELLPGDEVMARLGTRPDA